MDRWDRKFSRYAGVHRRDRLREPVELVLRWRKRNTKASISSSRYTVSPLRSPIPEGHGLTARCFAVSCKPPMPEERGEAKKCVAWKKTQHVLKREQYGKSRCFFVCEPERHRTRRKNGVAQRHPQPEGVKRL